LLLHPAVREAAAFAVPHPRLGENVAAAAVLHPGAKATSSELIDFIYDRLAPFQMPRDVQFVESLPVGPTGKISRARLSESFAAQHLPTEQPAAPLEVLIAEMWRKLLGRSDIGLDDDFFEIGGDSLQATEAFPRYEDGSAVTHLTPDDPPVFLYYSRSNTPPPPGDLGTGIHHPRFGYFLKEKMDKLGIECIVRIKDDYEGKPPGQPQREMVDFFLRHFPTGE
jgi:hypothetical protein